MFYLARLEITSAATSKAKTIIVKIAIDDTFISKKECDGLTSRYRSSVVSVLSLSIGSPKLAPSTISVLKSIFVDSQN